MWTTCTLYGVMVGHGDWDKLVWGTEVGAPDDYPDPSGPWTATTQATWITEYLTVWNTQFRDFTGPMIMKAIRDDPGTSYWSHLGLLPLDRMKPAKPAYAAFQTTLGQLP